MLRRWSLLSVLSFLLITLPANRILSALAAEGTMLSESEQVRVICPAIEEDARRRTNYPDEPKRPIELVVLGTSKSIAQSQGEDRTYQIQVTRVLYGALATKTVRFSFPWIIDNHDPLIFALVPAMYGGPHDYELKYILPGDEEKSQTALSAARLDFHVLSSACIFIGKETAADRDFRHTVEIVRPIYGPVPAEGNKVTIEVSGYSRNSSKVLAIQRDPMVYFIRTIRTDHKNKTEIYGLDCRLSAEREADVLAALARRNAYPVQETKKGDETSRFREVMFRGTIDEAIDMLGSQSEAAVTLASRMLIYHKDTAIAKISSAAEQDLFRQAKQAPGQFAKLQNLIKLLGRMGEGTPEGVVGRMLEKYMTYIAAGAAAPPVVQRAKQDLYFGAESDNNDVNHGLAWLLFVMDENIVVQKYGARLLKLRDQANSRWKAEIQLALDAAKVEDDLALSAAMKRMKAVKPVRSPTVPWHTGGAPVETIALSHDGKYLASAGYEGEIRIWNMTDWSCVQTIQQEGSITRLIFSPDDRFLYVAGGYGVEIHCRFEWCSGKLDKVFQGHHKGISHMELSPDGHTMITSSLNEEVLHVWDTETAKIVKSFDLPKGGDKFAYAPNAGLLLYQKEKYCTLAPLNGSRLKPMELTVPNELLSAAFTPNEEYLVTAEDSFSTTLMEHKTFLNLRSIADNCKVVGNIRMLGCSGNAVTMAISSDGKFLAVGDRGCTWASTACPN